MNIGIFTECYHPLINGVIVSVDTYKNELTNLGHNVFIFAPSAPGYIDKDKNILRFSSLPYPSPTKYRLPFPYPLSNFQKIKELKLDVVHTQSPFFIGQIAKYVARKFHLPLIFTFHTKYHEYTHYVPIVPQKILKWTMKNYSKIFCNSCDAIVAPSEDIKEMLVEFGVKTEIAVIPTGIDINEIESVEPIDIKKKFNIPENFSILMFAGRLAKEKNIYFLLDVYLKIKKKKENTYLLFVGGGPEQERLNKEIKKIKCENYIFVTGMVPKKEVIGYYKSSDVFLFPSLTETQGLVILEAQSSGLVPVALNATGVRDVINSNIDGILVENNADIFAEEVLNLLDNTERKKKMSESAKINAKKFSSSCQAQKLIDVYLRTTNLPLANTGEERDGR